MTDLKKNKIYIACDHTGTEVLAQVLDYIRRSRQEWDPIVTWTPYAGDDYPDVAWSVVSKMSHDESSRGILICGSAVGIAMAANREKHIRAVAAYGSHSEVAFARRHEDANVLCLSAWWSPVYVIQGLINVFLNEPFEGGRHLRRLYKMSYERRD